MKIRAGCVVLLLASLAAAQDRPRKPPQQPEILKSYVATQNGRLENELATLIQKRSETPANDQPYHELKIDLRIMQRWLVQQLTQADPFSDAQAVYWLRHRDMNDLIATVDGWAIGQGGKPATRVQVESMAAIHKLTYDLKPVTSVAELDAVLVPLRGPLLRSLGDQTGKAADMRPDMPKVALDKPAADQPQSAEPPSLDQLSTTVTRLTISIPLRQQLLAAVAATRQAEGDEQAALLDMLRSAVELASALQSNVAVDVASRPVIEAQLGEAVSLYSDPRLRDAAETRLKGLSQYRELAGRVSSLPLAPDTVRALAPAFAYARANPADSATVLGAIETYAGIEQKLAALKPAESSDLISRTSQAQFKQLLDLRAGFLEDAEKLGGGGMFASAPKDLADRIAAMNKTASMLDILKRHPQTMTTLGALKPRPTGGLERRATQALVKLATDDDAQQFITNLDKLATTWTNAQQSLATPIPAEIMQKYANTTWEAFQTRVRDVVTEAANAAASTGTLDGAKVDSITRLLGVIDRMRALGELETRLSVDAAVNRWADCAMDDDKLTKLLDSYRNDFAQIVTDTLAGTGGEKEAQRLTRRYQGLLNTLDLIARAAEPCQQLPAGPMGQVARLTTPSDKAPYAHVRYLSFMTDLIELTRMSAEADVDAINKLQDQMLDHLNKR
jgi:hypothetical protein